MKQSAFNRRDAMRIAASAPLLVMLPPALRAQPDGRPRPGDDFYRYANAAEIEAMVIPPDRWDYGQTDIAGARVEKQIAELVRTAVSRESPRSPEEARVNAVHRALLDEAAIERSALAALKHDLAALERARTHEDLAVLMADPRSSSLAAFNVFPVQGAWVPYIDTYNHNQPPLGLPGWLYAAEDEGAIATREAYARLITELLTLAGFDNGARRAADVVSIEKAIAARQWSLERLRDRRANLHLMTVDELQSFASGLPWRPMLDARGLDGAARLNLGTDSAVAALAELFAATPADTWRSWLAFSWIRNGIDAMPAALRDAHWRFTSRGGNAERPPREKEAIQFIARRMPMEIGRLYVDAHVPAGAREQAEMLVGYLKRAMRERLQGADWLDPSSRAEAVAKLDAMALKAVAPQSWPDWHGAELRADDVYGNLGKLAQRDWSNQRVRLTDAKARTQYWYQAPHFVDASYSVLFNAIEIPGAILQPPYFSADGDPAANFGGIGAIIGHEIGHGFDDQGMLYDNKGILRDWISPDSKAEFARLAESLVAQYEAFEPLPGLRLNGRRTQGENIADLSGVSLALRAYQLYRAEHPGRGPDEREGLRSFFLSWATIWRYKAPDSAIRYIVANSYYVPPPYRVNGVVRNIDAWYDAFEVREGDDLYVAPEDRVRLW